MNFKLKNLYQYLIENNKHEHQGWHNSYKIFFEKIENLRSQLKGGYLLSAENDTSLLQEMLYDKSNGVTSRGQSVLSHENFMLFIRNPNFIKALSDLITEPSAASYSTFERTWRDQKKSYNPVLINRTTAACTLNVSTTVDEAKFDQVFYWLINKNIINPYPDEAKQDWYHKNEYLMGIVYDSFKDELDSGKTDKFYLSQFVWAIYENLSNPFILKKQVVKYGSPGTGKTYVSRQQTKLLFDIWQEEFDPGKVYSHHAQIEVLQFHPSFSYEDFMEGLRPLLDSSGKAQLVLQNGVFKEFCRKAANWEIDVHRLGLKRPWEDLTIEDLVTSRDKLNGAHWTSIFAQPDRTKRIAEAVPPFFLIIDEINRAELSRVFGELMYCLEYRGVKGLIKTQYGPLNTERTGMLLDEGGYKFFIPSNVYIIGTMNTIDRSVESFDFALRRRFRWEEVLPDTGLLRYHLNQVSPAWVKLSENLEKLNTAISREPLLGSDYQIGHAYLMHLKYPKKLSLSDVRESVWEDSIKPLLQEYLRGTGRSDELIDSFASKFGL